MLFAITSVAGGKTLGIEAKEKVLKNGLKVIVVEDHSTPTVTFQVWYKVGSYYEQFGKTGISHLLEHMMFKGTKKYPTGEFSKIVSRNGGQENAFTSRDYTAYFENWASDRLEISMDLESDRMVNLQFDQEEFEREKSVVMEERRLRTEDDPTSLLVEEVYAAAYKAHPYHWPVIGWMKDIESITLEDLKKHYKTFYAPNNAVIVVVGDADADKVFSLVEKYFGDIPPRKDIPKFGYEEPPQEGERRVVVKSPEARLPFIFGGFHVPNIGSGEEYTLKVLAVILGGGRSSRIYKKLVFETQKALYAGAYYSSKTKDPGLFCFYAAVEPGEKPEEVEKLLWEEIENLKNKGIDHRELEKAKNQVESDFIYGLDSNFYRAMNIGILESIGRDWRYLNTFVDNVRKVTAEDVLRVARKYLVRDNLTIGYLLPEERKE
ncbi:peptidase M16 [Thermosulfidibacter takaii ABI70S6]|uniref:Peptidase M16 n=1 Tax=Thermosulfidibacter takaii (strain DSM 17441 / JCM 13301 / NBRC 103674 / ABI70S6) TaxID=1298851 RepID=A0A0S3QVV1_THET7|nr:peptidase M16 [Thermosulfidibacter takaii ABI70S6]